jgi:methyl-accepting chemotaxis protein
MYFSKYAAGIFVIAGILSLFLANGGSSISQYANAQSLGEQIGDTIGGALDETGEAAGNATQGLSAAINETGQAADNATTADESASQAASEVGQAADNATTADESASQAANNTASEMGQAADNATSIGGNTTNTTSQNPLDMLMNLFKN